jgi:hypothetical protein
VYLKDTKLKIVNSGEQITNLRFTMQNIQIDNQASLKPLYPIILQPRCLLDSKVKPHDHDLSKPVITIIMDMRTDNPDVAYYDKLSFLV